MPFPRLLRTLAGLLAASVLLLLSLPAADAAAAAARTCRAPDVRFGSGRDARCIAPARGGVVSGARALQRATAADARARVRGRGGAAAKRKVARLRRLFDGAAMRRASALALAPPPGGRATAAGSGAERCAGPADLVVEPSRARRDGLVVAIGQSRWGNVRQPLNGTTTVTTVSGDGVTVAKTDADCISWDICPRADGRVEGAVTRVWEERRVAAVPGVGRVVQVVRSELTARARATVGIDARSGAYDVVADTVTTASYEERLADGRLFARAPTRTHRLHTVLTGLDQRANGRGGRVVSRVARGPKGAAIEPAAARLLALFDETTIDAQVRTNAAHALLAAERNWYDAMACATLAVTTATPTVAVGQRVEAALRLSARDGQPASGRYDVEWGSADQLSGPLPGGFSLVVPERAPGSWTATSLIATSPAGRAAGALKLELPASAPRYRVSISGSQAYDWSYESRTHFSPGTDSACEATATGRGRQLLLFATRGGDEGSAELRDGQLTISPGGTLSTVMTRQGELSTTSRGPGQNCGGTTHEPTGGCAVEAAMPDLAPRLEWAEGRLTLALEQYRPPAFDPCPLRTPDYGRALDAGLIDQSSVELPLARLAAGEPRIELRLALPLAGHEDCTAPDGPGCTNDDDVEQSYAIDATKTLAWTIVLERVTR